MNAFRVREGLLALVLGCCVAPAWAHGDVVAKRGGLAVPAGEHSIELVLPAAGRVRLFVDDHGDPVSVKGAAATVLVRRAQGEEQFATLTVVDNALEGHGIDLRPGDRIQVAVKLADGQVVVANATIP
jgi:hypothetical protein